MSNSFDLATGYVTFKGDFSQFEKDIATSQEKLKVLQDSLKNPMAMRMAVGESMRLAKEFERAQKAAKRMVDEIRLGKMGVLLRDASAAFGKFQDRLKMVGAVGVGVGAGAMGLAAAASPVAADTFQKSIKLAAATIGQDFVPAMMQVSFLIQDATRAWDQLNPAIKSNIVETVKMVAVAGAASVAMLGLGKALNFIANHPVLVGVAAGTFAGNAINDNVNQMGALQGDRANRNMRQDVSFVRDDVRTAMFKGRKDGEQLAREDFERARSIYNEKATASNNYQKGWFGGGGFMGGLQRGFDWTGGKQRSLINEAETAGIEMAKTRERLNEVLKSRGKEGIANPLQEKGGGLNSFIGGLVGQGFKNQKDRYDIAASGPSSYSSLQEFYRSFNIASTSADSFDQKMLDIATKQLEGINKMRDNLERIVPAQ